jgi:hypothetical protein
MVIIRILCQETGCLVVETIFSKFTLTENHILHVAKLDRREDDSHM